MMELEGELLQAISSAFEEHDRECNQRAFLVLLNPGNHELLGWDEIFGLPVLPDERVAPMNVRLACCAAQAAREPRWAGTWGGERVWWLEEQPYLEDQAEADTPV